MKIFLFIKVVPNILFEFYYDVLYVKKNRIRMNNITLNRPNTNVKLEQYKEWSIQFVA